METTGLLTEPAPQRRRSAAPIAIAIAVSTIGCAVLLLSSRSSFGATSAGTTELPGEGVHFHFEDTSPGYGTLVGDDLIQENWGGLTCGRTDDDKWGWGQDDISGKPNNNSGTNCVWGDTHYCTQHFDVTDDGTLSEMPDLLWQYCNASCNTTDESAIAAQLLYNTTEATMVGSSMLAACAFGGVRHMRDVCADNKVWTEQYKSARRAMAVADPSTTRHFNRNDWYLQRRVLNYDNPPSVPDRDNTNLYINGSNHTQYLQQGCNTHGLCGTCVESNGTINKYCEAFLQYYDVDQQFKEHDYRTHNYDAENFWYNVHFWCNETILDAIQDGTFKEKLVDGHIQDAFQVEYANSNEQELEFWGTTNPPQYKSETGHSKGDN